jgi:hypothetical protein
MMGNTAQQSKPLISNSVKSTKSGKVEISDLPKHVTGFIDNHKEVTDSVSPEGHIHQKIKEKIHNGKLQPIGLSKGNNDGKEQRLFTEPQE